MAKDAATDEMAVDAEDVVTDGMDVAEGAEEAVVAEDPAEVPRSLRDSTFRTWALSPPFKSASCVAGFVFAC